MSGRLKPGPSDDGMIWQHMSVVSSMLVTCSLALEAAEDWKQEIRSAATEDIRHTLIYASRLVDQQILQVVKLEDDDRAPCR